MKGRVAMAELCSMSSICSLNKITTLIIICGFICTPIVAVSQRIEIIGLSEVENGHNVREGRVFRFRNYQRNYRCQKINSALCTGMPYNYTMMPNILGMMSQEEAGMELHKYFPLVKVGCFPQLHFFLCSSYFPICSIMDEPLAPCRPLCLAVKRGCEDLMHTFGLQWPEALDCNKFSRGPEDRPCIGPNDAKEDNINLFINKPHTASQQEKRNEIDFNINSSLANPTIRGMNFHCPLHFIVPEKKKYSLRVGGIHAENCGAPCHGMFFSKDKIVLSRTWVAAWAIFCLISSSFTIGSFLVDSKRFRYPERPIIFISLCYWFIAMTYILGIAHGDNISCDKPWDPPPNLLELKHTMVSTIRQGVGKELCTITFMVLYFFTMAASTWWVILTIAWFLAAGLKWSHEALENSSTWFHVAAWAPPAIKTTIVLALETVEGDVMSGVCYVGLWNIDAMRWFVLAPLLLHLVVGTCFLVIGFISLFRIRTIMKHDGAKTDKLERFMVRIGIFSLLYTVPASIMVACLIIEQYYLDKWTLTWQYDKCRLQYEPWINYGINCPRGIDPRVSPETLPRASLIFYLVKYLSSLIAGVASGFWVCTGKTISIWRKCLSRCCGGNTEAEV